MNFRCISRVAINIGASGANGVKAHTSTTSIVPTVVSVLPSSSKEAQPIAQPIQVIQITTVDSKEAVASKDVDSDKEEEYYKMFCFQGV